MKTLLAPALLALATALTPLPAATQGTAGTAKKDLVARVLKLQQPGIEQMGRMLAEQPAQQMLVQARAALQRVPADKRDAVAKEMEADLRKYVDEAVPIVRNRAVQLAPETLGPLLEERFSEDELRQIIAMLESPVNAKYQAMAADLQRALGAKLIADTKGQVEPKVQALQKSLSGRISAVTPKAN